MSVHLSSASAETVVIVVIEIGAISGSYTATHTTVDMLVMSAFPSSFGSAEAVTVVTEVIAAEAVITMPPAVLLHAPVLTLVMSADPSLA